MDEESKTTAPEVENPVENQTDEGSAAKQDDQAHVDKQEESPYAKQLEELRAREKELNEKLEKQNELIANKNRAIESMKKKPAESEDELVERAIKRIEGRQTEERVVSKVNALTGDSAEREVIMKHYQSSIVKTGNLDEDLKSAIALAQRDQIWESRSNKALEERREDFITAFAGTSLRGEAPSTNSQDPIMRQAEALVRSINPEALKYLGKS